MVMINPKTNKSIVFTNGCFDTLHLGHFKFLEFCKYYGIGNFYPSNYVIVGLNDDESVRQLKGEDRPFYSTMSRRFMLQSLEFVDEVVVFSGTSVMPLLDKIKPNILIKGGTTGDIEGADFVESYGGSVIRYENVVKVNGEVLSTTRLINMKV